MSASQADLGGVPLVGDVHWSLTAGVEPYVTTVTVHASVADRLMKSQGKPLTLTLGGAKGVVVERVYLVSEVGQPNPYTRSFLIADGRWLWQRKFIHRHFNRPRKTGDRQILEGGPVDIANIVDTFTFAPWSLKSGSTRWNAKDALLDVLNAVHDYGVGFLFTPSVSLPIENLLLDDSGSGAVARVLANVPGADVYIGLNGVVYVFNRNDLAGVKGALKKLGPVTVLGGVAAEVKQKAIRPKHIEVLFDREVELRFDSVAEGNDGEFDYANQSDGTLFMDNVLPLPDLELTLGGKRIFRGTWVSIKAVVEAWASELTAARVAAGKAGISGAAFTLENIRKFWFSGMWTAWAELGKIQPDADWVARIAAIRTHFRRTYRLARQWMARIKSLRGTRVAVVDPVTGTRAPALVESDYCVQPAEKIAWNNVRDYILWLNVQGYPTDGLISGGRPTPAVVRVLDEDLGVIHLELHTDPYGNAAAIHPSLVVNGNGETGAPSNDFRTKGAGKRSPVIDGKVRGTDGAWQLSSNHRCLVVITAAPGAPNNERSLHSVIVKPDDVKGMLAGVTIDGDGEPWQVRVPAATYTARFAWDDEKADLYPNIFGFNSDNPDDAGVDSSVIDTGEIWQNSKECKSLAKAAAASVYARLADHMEGHPVYHMNDVLEPVGNLATVTHRVAEDGRLLTEASIPPSIKPIDLFAILDSNTRAIVLGLVQFKAAG